MSFRKIHLPLTKKNKLTELTEPGQEIQVDVSGKLQNKNIAGETSMLIGTD